MELNQLFEGSNNYKTLQADAARLSGKWAKSGLLEGISNEIERNNMAMILENQAKQIVSENTTGTGAIGTSTGGAEQWAGVALPLVRKVFAQIAAKDFVSVQPMNLPSGLVFYLDFKYGTSTNSSTFSNSQILSYKTVWDESTNKAVLQNTGSSFSGYTFAYDKGIYQLERTNRDIAFRASATTAATLQTVSNFYGQGIKVPAGSYGSQKAADGNSYVRTSGGDNWANTNFSIGSMNSTSNVVPIIATPKSFSSISYSSPVYSNSSFNFSNTSKVYSIR